MLVPAAAWYLTLTEIFFIIFSLLLVFIIIQPANARGEGIGAAFGGISSETFFGTKTHQYIHKATIVIAVIYLLLAVIILYISRPTK